MSQPRNAAPIDESVRVPDAVRRASERASQVHQEAYGTTPEPEPQPNGSGNGQGAAQPQNRPPAAAPAAAPASPAPATIPEEPTRSEHVEPGSWEARYWSMKGRYDAGQRRVTDQENRLGHLEQLLADVATRQPEPPQPEPTIDPSRPLSEQRFITDKEREEYGPELTDMIERVARGIAGNELAAAKAEITTLKQQVGNVGNVVATDARARLLATLDQQMAGWRTQNQDPEFLEWLELPDVYSGARRMDLLRQAFDRSDVARVLAFFNGFNAEKQAAAPAPSAPAPLPAPAVRLEDLAAPGRARTQAASAPPAGEKPIITAAQISQFYDDCRRGRYNGRDADRIALEGQIFEAQREGRIR